MGTILIIIIIVFVLGIIFLFTKKVKVESKPVNKKAEIPLPDFVKKNPETGETRIEISFEKSTSNFGTFLVFDIETTGLPKVKGAKSEDLNNWPRVVQISWLLLDSAFKEVNSETHYLKQDAGIPIEATMIHKIDDKIIEEKGEDPKIIFEKFLTDIKRTSFIVAHNIDFDAPIIESEFIRYGLKKPFRGVKKLCTMKAGTKYCEIPKAYGSGYKYPKLEELFHKCFFSRFYKIKLEQSHDAQIDTTLTAKCFIKLKELGYFKSIEI